MNWSASDRKHSTPNEANNNVNKRSNYAMIQNENYRKWFLKIIVYDCNQLFNLSTTSIIMIGASYADAFISKVARIDFGQIEKMK